MRQTPKASRRTLLIIGIGLAFVASACSSSGSDSASTTTVPAATTSTAAATTSTEAPADTTTSTTEAAPETTAAPATTTTPPSTPVEAEQVAVAFLRAGIMGGDTRSFVNDQAVAEAAILEWADVADADRAGFTVQMDPTYVEPDSQAGGPGECQLMGDITLQCSVEVTPPSGQGDPALYAVYVTNIDPASSIDDPAYIDYYVVDFERLIG